MRLHRINHLHCRIRGCKWKAVVSRTGTNATAYCAIRRKTKGALRKRTPITYVSFALPTVEQSTPRLVLVCGLHYVYQRDHVRKNRPSTGIASAPSTCIFYRQMKTAKTVSGRCSRGASLVRLKPPSRSKNRLGLTPSALKQSHTR